MRTARNAAIAIALFAALAELAAYYVDAQLTIKGVIYRPYRPPTATHEKIADPTLGWHRPLDAEQDRTGARFSPAFPDPNTPACVALYGDSYIWGLEVDAESAWGNQLSRRIGCRVANYGVSGYGTDQALLRFESKSDDHAPVVILGHLSEDIVRNVNQMRFLLGRDIVGLKPRFVLADDGSLQLVPQPQVAEQDYAKLLEHPERYLDHEELLPGSAYGPVRGRLSRTWSVFASLTSFRIRERLAGRGYWESFYQLDHPTHGLAITAAIARRFVAKAHGQGRTPAVILFPTEYDFDRHRNGAPWCYAPLAEQLRRDGITFFDAGEYLYRELAGRPARSIFAIYHLNAEGNRMLAAGVEQFLKSR